MIYTHDNNNYAYTVQEIYLQDTYRYHNNNISMYIYKEIHDHNNDEVYLHVFFVHSCSTTIYNYSSSTFIIAC